MVLNLKNPLLALFYKKMQTLVSHYFCTYALDQDLRFKNKNLKIDFGPFLVFFTQTHFSIQEPPWTFANYYFFSMTTIYKCYTICVFRSTSSKKKIKKCKKRGFGAPRKFKLLKKLFLLYFLGFLTFFHFVNPKRIVLIISNNLDKTKYKSVVNSP